MLVVYISIPLMINVGYTIFLWSSTRENVKYLMMQNASLRQLVCAFFIYPNVTSWTKDICINVIQFVVFHNFTKHRFLKTLYYRIRWFFSRAHNLTFVKSFPTFSISHTCKAHFPRFACISVRNSSRGLFREFSSTILLNTFFC